MTEEWSLRDEIFYTAHRWPVISLFCLAGVLVGWLVSILVPSPYSATKELYVGLSIYRASEDENNTRFSGIAFNNADDYKNWQMANLNTMVLMDPIVDYMLTVLRENDPYWQTVSSRELAGMLHVYWRNAGKWRLVAENEEAERASQMVTLWEETAVPLINYAVSQAQQVMALDLQMDELAAKQASLLEESAKKGTLYQELIAAQAFLNNLSPEQVLNELERWQVWLPVSKVVSSPEYIEILNTFPIEPAPAAAYQPGLDKALVVMELEMRALDEQILQINTKSADLAAEYALASTQSMGFSPNLKVDRITDEKPLITRVRPTGVSVLVGAGLGFILWLLLSFVRINKKVSK